MKTSTEIGSIALHTGEEKAVELVAKAGLTPGTFQCSICVKRKMAS